MRRDGEWVWESIFLCLFSPSHLQQSMIELLIYWYPYNLLTNLLPKKKKKNTTKEYTSSPFFTSLPLLHLFSSSSCPLLSGVVRVVGWAWPAVDPREGMNTAKIKLVKERGRGDERGEGEGREKVGGLLGLINDSIRCRWPRHDVWRPFKWSRRLALAEMRSCDDDDGHDVMALLSGT